jgi:hypothetical protein
MTMNEHLPNDGNRDGNPRSTAALFGHPLHPMLVPFPIVCFTGALVTECARGAIWKIGHAGAHCSTTTSLMIDKVSL